MRLSSKSKNVLYPVLFVLPNLAIIIFFISFHPEFAKYISKLMRHGFGLAASFFLASNIAKYSLLKNNQKTRKTDSRLLSDTCNGPRKGIRCVILFDIGALLSDFKTLTIALLMNNCPGKSAGIGITYCSK